MTLKNLRIVHISDPLLGDEPQLVATFLNCAHDGCQPISHGRLSLPWRLIGCVLRKSDDDAQGKAQRENSEQKSFQGKEPPFQAISATALY
jgi:hypothetical protein